GFQFERIVRLDDFMKMMDTLQPNPRLRNRR
ncbi:MAG: pilus assembly protein PilZ, partial [Sphingomonadales bacterium 32-64-17]